LRTDSEDEKESALTSKPTDRAMSDQPKGKAGAVPSGTEAPAELTTEQLDEVSGGEGTPAVLAGLRVGDQNHCGSGTSSTLSLEFFVAISESRWAA
jgi:hypothetical protein